MNEKDVIDLEITEVATGNKVKGYFFREDDRAIISIDIDWLIENTSDPEFWFTLKQSVLLEEHAGEEQ